jgi:hypothetical protein
VGIIASKIYSTPNIIREHESRLSITTLSGELVEKSYKELKNGKLWVIDPCTDELYYKNENIKEAFSKCIELSSDVREFLTRMTPDNYNLQWDNLNNNTAFFMKFVGDFVKCQGQLKSDIICPPVPLITADSPDHLIELWHKIVRTTGVLAKTLLEKNSAIVLNLHYNLFRRPAKLNSLFKKLSEMVSDSTISEIKAIIIKLQGEELESDTGETRARFRQFMIAMGKYAILTKRAIFMLDTSSVGLICISLGLDGFIEPLNGVVGSRIAMSKDKHGRYYHPDGLKFTRFNDLKAIYANNNQKLPCHCSSCLQINSRDLENDVSLDEWNNARRSHLLECRNAEIEEYHETIEDNTISNAIVDKVQRSDIKNLLDVLPK